MTNYMKLVDYEKFCKTCRFGDQIEIDEPCNECLTYPVNEETEKPINWKEKE